MASKSAKVTTSSLRRKRQGQAWHRARGACRDRVLVENVNLVKKHIKPNPNAASRAASSIKRCRSHISNVARVQPGDEEGDRVGFQDAGRRQQGARIFKNGEVVWSTSVSEMTDGMSRLQELFGTSLASS